MTFEEIVDQSIDMVRRRGRVTYQMLKRQFNLDNEALADLKEELIYAQRLAEDENERVLVWTGIPVSTPSPASAPTYLSVPVREPLSYTPLYLTKKILTSRSALEGERKQVTVLFADVVGLARCLSSWTPSPCIYGRLFRPSGRPCASL